MVHKIALKALPGNGSGRWCAKSSFSFVSSMNNSWTVYTAEVQIGKNVGRSELL